MKNCYNYNVILDEGAFMPVRAHKEDAGLDLFSPIDMLIPANGSRTIDTGVHIEIPFGYAGLIVSKSGLNVNHDLNSTGLVDGLYHGSIRVKLYNHGPNSYMVHRQDKISQIVIFPVNLFFELKQVDHFETESERGSNGFGSTGR